MNINELFIESKSPYDFEKTVELLNNTILEKGWKMPALHDLQQTMKNFGKDVLPVKVFEICHPRHSSRILERNDERIASALMPCRISVYLKEDGNTYISRINSANIAKSVGGVVSEVMKDATAELEDIIENALKV